MLLLLLLLLLRVFWHPSREGFEPWWLLLLLLPTGLQEPGPAPVPSLLAPIELVEIALQNCDLPLKELPVPEEIQPLLLGFVPVTVAAVVVARGRLPRRR